MTRSHTLLVSTFPLSGLVTTMLGPLLPALIERWRITDAQAGQLFLAQFLASTAGALCSSRLISRRGAPRVLAFAYSGMSLAVVALPLLPEPAAWIAVAGWGFTLGVSIPATNLLVALGPEATKVARLNLLNMTWGIGAVFSAPIVLALLHVGGLPAVVALVSGLCLLTGILAGAILEPEPAGPQTSALVPITAAHRTMTLAAACFAFLYVGTENGLNGWLPLLAQRTEAAQAATGAMALALFWMFLLGSRLAVSLLPRVSSQTWIVAGLATALAGIALVLASPHAGLLWVGSAAAGFGLGPLFPTAIARFQSRAGAASERLIGFLFAAAGCGGGALSWLVGALSTTSGSLRIGLLTTALATLGMLFARRGF